MDKDNQDHKKLQATPGSHEGQGVHLCHQCEWPFPNPHPSAKQRRAHKKVCGTLEGYKLADSASEDHTVTVTDYDNFSDDDSKTPSPKPKEKGDKGRNSVGIGERSNRSEDEVFADAAMEFPESGFGPAIVERPNDARVAATDVQKSEEKDLTIFYSFKDNAFCDIIEVSNCSTDSNQVQNPEVPEIATALSESNLDSQVNVSSSTKESAVIELSNDSTESNQVQNPEVPKNATALSESNLDSQVNVSSSTRESAVIEPSNDSTESNQVQNPEVPENATSEGNLDSLVNVSSSIAKPETPMHVSQENKTMNASDSVRDGLMTYVGQGTDAKGNNEINSERNLHPFSPSECWGQTSKAESKFQEIEKITSDPMSAAEVVPSKEDNGAEMVCKTSSGDPIPRIESVELLDASAIVQNKVSVEQGVASSSVNLMEGSSGKGEENENVHEPSVPADIPLVANAESMLEDFKDHKGVKLRQHVTLDSSEIIKDKKDDSEVPVSMEDHDSLQTRRLSEVSKVSASDMHVVEDDIVNHNGNHVVGNPSTEGDSDESQIKLTSNDGSNAFGAPTAAVTVGVEQSNPVSSIENQRSDVSDTSSHVCVQETAMMVSHDVNPVVASSDINVIGLDEAVNQGNLATEMYDVGKDEKERFKEEDYAENTITSSDSATKLPEFRVNPAISESDGAGDHDKAKIEKCVAVGVKSKEETSEERLLLETKTAFESDGSLHESQAIDRNTMDVSLMKLPETKLTDIKEDSGIPENSKQLEVKGNDGLQGEFNAEHGRNIDSLERTSEDHSTKAPLLLPSDTESSMQVSFAADDNRARENSTRHSGVDQASQGENNNNNFIKTQFGAPSIDAAVDSSRQTGSLEGNRGSVIDQASQGENNNNNFVKTQFGAPSIDASVDSSSQTDSLEGNWGSVSVLSTQSDTPAFVDTEALASAEAEKSNLKKLECATERQQSEKSDSFEPPSFMTLVEPGCGSDKKAAASNIDMLQNLEQKTAPSQAGWFPSITNVVNESPGRKKNEEIINKVANWSTGKHHIPLKNLLVEDNLETKPKSPNPRENKDAVLQKDEKGTKEKNAKATTVSSILGPGVPNTESAQGETGKELNSPASYPADIKREKRKVKGRPYWAQFVCCSSVN